MLLEYPLAFWMTAALAVLLVGIDKTGFGGGLGALATPLMALTIPVGEAAALLLPLLLVANVVSVYHYRRSFEPRHLRLLLPFALVGVALGGFFFRLFASHEGVLKVTIGVIAVGFVLYQGARVFLFKRLGQHPPGPVWGGLLGAAAGFTSTVAHVGGPLAALYLLPQGLPRSRFVGTTALLFFAVNLVKLLPYALLGLLSFGKLPVVLVLAPLAILGARLGVWLNGRFSEVWFNRVIYGLLLLTGLQLISGKTLWAMFQ